jgi:hypothetical protein
MMKLNEIRFDLFEVLNTKVKILWKDSSQGYIGEFELDDAKYAIHLDEYDADIIGTKYSLVDFGFTKDGKWAMQNDNKNSSKVLGAVLNGFIDKIKQISPDAILFGVNFKNGANESRISLYGRLASLYAKGSSYHYESDWIKTKNGQYKIVAKKTLSKDEEEFIEQTAANIESKH